MILPKDLERDSRLMHFQVIVNFFQHSSHLGIKAAVQHNKIIFSALLGRFFHLHCLSAERFKPQYRQII